MILDIANKSYIMLKNVKNVKNFRINHVLLKRLIVIVPDSGNHILMAECKSREPVIQPLAEY